MYIILKNASNLTVFLSPCVVSIVEKAWKMSFPTSFAFDEQSTAKHCRTLPIYL